jgi:hypothetical protein
LALITRSCRLSAAVAGAALLALAGCSSRHSTSSGAAGDASATAAGSSAGARSSVASSAAKPGTAAKSGTAAVPKSSAPASGGLEGSSAPSLSACTVASSAEVTAAFGGKVSSASTSTTGTGAQLCKFVLSNSKLGSVVTISVSTHEPVDRAAFDRGKATAVKAGSVAVSGVGDSAYYTRLATTLQFHQSRTAGFVQASIPLATGASSARLQPSAAELARSIVGGL